MQFTLRYLTIIFCFSLFYTEKGFSQTYNFQSYSVKQGIPSSQILSIYQDNLGFMWFGTHGGGVCKFDGKKFITYTVNDSLGSNYVYSIGQDNSGHLLFATDNGLSVFNGKTIRNIRIPQGLPDNWVWKILKASDGKIWLGTKKGVCYMENGIIKNIPAINGDSSLQQNTIFNIYEDVKKNIWFCTKRAGIKSIQNNSLVSYTQNQGLSMNAVFCAGEDANNNLLIGTFKGLDKVINQTIENTRDPNLGAMIRITGIVKDNFNNLWLTTPTGLFYKTINATTFKQITVSGGLPSEILTALYKDAEGNLWIGTDGGGIAKFSSLKFINYNRKDSLPSDYINAIKILDNKVLIGTNFGGMIFNKEEKIYKTFKRPLTFSANQMIGSKVASIEADSSLIYFGTQNGLSVYDGKKFTNYDTASGLKVNNIRCIKLIAPNQLLISTDAGLNLYKNGKIDKEFDPLNRITNVAVWNIALQDEHIIWLATDNGLVKYNANTKEVKKYGSREGLEDGYIRTVCVDDQKNVWITTPNGLYFFNHKTFRKFTEREGFPNLNNIYSLTIDPQGFLLIGTGKGLDKLDLKYFYKSNKIALRSYTEQDGFIGDECNLNAAYMQGNGQLWLGTVKGITVFNKQWDKQNKIQPQTRITDIRLSFEKFDYSTYSTEYDSVQHLPINLTLPYNKNHVSFDYVGLSFTNPEVVVYKYKLEGLEDKWSPVTSKTEAVYPSLPPGTYTFKVIARNNDGLWNDTPTEITFTITPPFWKTTWFIALMIITGALSVYSFIKYRTKKLEESKIFLEKQVSERTKELRQEKEKVEQYNQEVLEQKHIIEEKNKDITDSINYAKRIQLAVLPALTLVNNGFKNHFILYRPKDIVSGDFYWYAEKDGKYFIAAADCTGHGVPGAFMSMIGTNLLNQAVIEKGVTEPGKILTAINNLLKEAFSISEHRFDTKDGMDIALCAYNPTTNTLEYAGANRPLYFIRNQVLEEIKATKNPIGAQTPNNSVFTNHNFNLQNGDIFYLTSDGYADQFGGTNGKKFMTKNLKELLINIHTQSLDKQSQALENTILTWMEGYEQIDDELIIGIKF